MTLGARLLSAANPSGCPWNAMDTAILFVRDDYATGAAKNGMHSLALRWGAVGPPSWLRWPLTAGRTVFVVYDEHDSPRSARSTVGGSAAAIEKPPEQASDLRRAIRSGL